MIDVIAHRGASAVRQENTLEAFRHAVELGADWIEIDVRRTADDVLIISHDAHVPDGRAIVEHAYDELPESMPTMAEALEACAGAKVNIEIKNDPDEPDYDREHQISDAVVGLALAFRGPDELLMSSFNMDTVRRIKAVNPQIPAALVTGVLVMDVSLQVARIAEAGLQGFIPWEPTVDRALIDRAHRAGLFVSTWTVNDERRMRELAGMGIDGLITDAPDVARTVVDGFSREAAGDPERGATR